MRAWMLTFSLGIWLATLAPALPAFNLLWVLLPSLLLVLSGRFVLSGAYFLGLSWCLFFLQQSAHELLPTSLENREIWIRGYITGLPQGNKEELRFHVKVKNLCTQEEAGACDGRWKSWPALVRLNYYGELNIVSGQPVTLQVRLKRPHGFANPHTFDYESWLWEQGIRATGYVRAAGATEDGNNAMWHSLAERGRFRLREKLNQVIDEHLPAELSQRPVILALVLGDRFGIDDEQWDTFSRTGTTHLMVISGLHIGLVAWLFFRLSGWLWSRSCVLMTFMPAPRFAALAGIAGALCYAAIAGFSLPATRALVMTALLLWGRFVLRQTNALDILCLALGLLLAMNPLAPVTAGFWLSFGAVALLLCFAIKPQEQAKKTDAELLDALAPRTRFSKIKDYLCLHLHTQWILLSGLFPLMLVFYGQVSLLAPLINLVAIPLVGLVVVPLCLLSLPLLYVWPGFAAQLLLLADCLLEGFQRVLSNLLALIPGNVLAFPDFSWWKLAVLGAGCLLLLQPSLRWRWRTTGLASLAVLLLPAGTLPSLKEGEVRFHVLDVGQGLAIIIETENHTILYDTGPAYSPRFNAGSGIIAPYMQGAGLPEPSFIIISHGDSDHAGGLSSLLQVFKEAEVFSGEPDRLESIKSAAACQSGQSWQLDKVTFLVLHPLSVSGKANNRSCVLRVSSGSRHVLMPGDIERDAEILLLHDSRHLLAADILIVPHHGSQTSSSPAFINQVSPTTAIISNGYLNRYHHPHEKVLGRYLNRGIRVLETAGEGALVFTLSGNEVKGPESWRKSHPRVWRNL